MEPFEPTYVSIDSWFHTMEENTFILGRNVKEIYKDCTIQQNNHFQLEHIHSSPFWF